MTAPHNSPIDEVRAMLFTTERTDLEKLKHQLNALQGQHAAELDALRQTVASQEATTLASREEQLKQITVLQQNIVNQNRQIMELNTLRRTVAEQEKQITQLTEELYDTKGRVGAVGEVLVAAVDKTQAAPGELGVAMKSEIEHAIHVSARDESVILAEALYPVMGPAIRKMIAGLFTPEALTGRTGEPFNVDQALLIDRETGLLLASSISDEARADDADIVSGMLDAIRMFVQEAFHTDDHDGLRDMRVGDTSVLVEWGPQAVLASVIRGVPTDEYRQQAAEALEALHVAHGSRMQNFDGDVMGFEPIEADLARLRQQSAAARQAERRKTSLRLVAGALMVVAVIALLIILIF